MIQIRLTGMPAFLLIWFGQFVSGLGSALSTFAIGIWLYETTGLVTTFTLMIFFSSIPRILLSPIAGALVDRFNRKLMMMLSDLAALVATIIIFLLLGASALENWHLYILVALSSAFESFQFPAYSAAITQMVDKKHYARTSAMLALADDGSRLIAPILAAVLIGFIQLEGIVLIDILSFGAALITLLLVPIPPVPASEIGKAAKRDFLADVAFGFRFIFSNPAFLVLQFNFFFVNLMLGMSTHIRTPMILARTDNNELILGIASSITAAGSVLGGLFMSIWGGTKRKIHGVLIGLILISFGRAILGIGQELILWSIGGFLILFFIAVANSSNQAIWQLKTPADVQGRVFAARRFTGQLSLPIAVLLAGFLSDNFFEPAMREGGSLAPIFGAVFGTGAGSGMSLLIFLTAIIGVIVPVWSYFQPYLRTVEDLSPEAIAQELQANPVPSGD